MVERIKHVTMKDIARRANVSQPAVSYALNNKKGLDDETRQRILDIATEMGYRPNLLMKGLRKGKSMSIGLMIQCDSDYFGRICFGAQQRLAQDGYVSILGYANEDNQLEEIYNLIDRRVDGIILFPSNPDAVGSGQGLEEIKDRRIPMVTVDTVIEGANEIDFVGTDDYVGGRQAAEHLLSLGHRTLAFWYPDSLDEKPTGSPIFERLKGFRDVVEEAGAEFVLSINETAASLLNASPRPTCRWPSGGPRGGRRCRSASRRGARP